MVQDQLVDYISSQLKLGVSSDAVKSALVSAGWVAGDVDDTLKKVQGASTGAGMGSGSAATSMASTKPAGMATSSPAMGGSSTAGASIAGATSSVGAAASVGKTGPQMIRVSDLVSASPSMSGSSSASVGMGSSMATATGMAMSAKPAAAKVDPAAFGGKISGNTFKATLTTGSGAMAMGGMKGGSSAMMAWIVAAVFLLGFGGLAWYFYSANGALSTKVSSLTAQSASVSSQLASLQAQMDASSTGLAAQVASLTKANQDLTFDLSFYAAPSTGASSTAITIPTGWLSVVKNVYWITLPQAGVKIAVANSSDPKILAQLKPLVGDTVQATGMYVPGSDQMTLETVTNLSPAAAGTSTTTTATTTTP